MSRRILVLLSTFVICLEAYPREKVRFMPQWTPQSQFAGYYVALEKGFFAEEGLDVEIVHEELGSSSNSIRSIDLGRADICTGQLIQAIVARSQSRKVVNVLQTSQNSSLLCVSHTPLKSFKDLQGKKVGRWKSGFGEIADICCHDLGVDVEWVYFIRGINLFVSGAIDATLCYGFSEYLDLLYARGRLPEENVLRFSECGYNYPEDGLYVREDFLSSHPDVVERFVSASRRGWDYVREHVEEALDVVDRYMRDYGVANNRGLQKRMLESILDLQVPRGTGTAMYSPVDRRMFESLVSKMQSLGIIDSAVEYEDMVR